MISRVVFAAAIAVGLLRFAQPAAAAQPYCPNPAHAAPAKVPADLVQAVARTFQIDDSAARDASFVRCAGAKLLACTVGANLNCGKADASRASTGAAAWCRENPGSQVIPMSATGHATIYQWTCKGARAVAGKTVMHADPRGYTAENWKEIQ